MPTHDDLFADVGHVLNERAAESTDHFELVRSVPGREPIQVPWTQTGVSPGVVEVLETEYPGGLYQHQAEAVRLARARQNVVVTTQTSSGKSLIYTVPIAEALMESGEATALLFFPTKALTNDQLLVLQARVSRVLARTGRACPPHTVARYDGSTPTDQRQAIRPQVRVMLTNPDMAHRSLLPWHERHWQRFLSNLRYIILDEAHEYRGTFGSNVSMLLRRLLLLCRRYGSDPQFISTSATIAEPAEHLQRLTGRHFAVVGLEQDGSRQGEKQFWIAHPGTHAFATARALLERLVHMDRSAIVFCLSRWSAEEVNEHFRTDPARRIRVYKAGLLPREREDIEQGLRDGRIRGVVSTSALELGIDIGLLDVCLCLGLPYTMMSLWQRAGRVGRSGQPGSVILIPEARPIDAYYSEHPEELFARPNEPLAINMQSPTLAKWHYACALNEADGDFTRVRPEDLGEPMETVARNHQEGRMDDTVLVQPELECKVTCLT